jgi:hypothetical protein
MPVSGTLRHEARQCLERAKELLKQQESSAARYACLELRQAIEYLAYQQLEAYLNEVPDDAMRKWTPREVIAQMLEVDPNADKSSTIAIGIEEVPGEHSKDMKGLGEDRRFTLKWANRSHNALGSFLHAPTLHQIETNSTPDHTKMRDKAEEVASVIEHTLATPIYNANFGNFYEIGCACRRQIKRRAGSFKIADGIVCPNVECRAIWDVVSEEGRSATFRQRQQAYACHQCKETNYVDSQRLKPGLLIRCDCGARAEVALAIMAVEDDKSETPAAP